MCKEIITILYANELYVYHFSKLNFIINNLFSMDGGGFSNCNLDR